MLLLALLACTPDPELSLDPSSLAFGEIDFGVEMPEEGYSPLPVSIQNIDKADHTLFVVADDVDHLCFVGFPEAAAPFELGTLPEGSAYTVQISVCDYDPGDRDSEYLTSVRFATETDTDPVELSVSFTPIRTIEE